MKQGSLEGRRAAARLFGLLAVAVLACLGMLSFAQSANAAPDIQLDKQAPASVLYGDKSRVRLHVSNPSGQPYGYNLSLRDVLPEGISYVPGSAVDESGAKLEPRVIADAPNEGQITLLFENVADLSAGSSYTLDYEVSHDTELLEIGDRYKNEADAYISDQAHLVPLFNAEGLPGANVTGESEDSAETEISALEIVKSQPRPNESIAESEMLRGVHDHQVLYTLTIRNNAIDQTTNLVVEDFLPAGLEFLGCGTEDNTTDAGTNPGSTEEYPGAGPINPGNAPAASECVEPDLVETINGDPDEGGTMPSGVYTRVVWNDLGSVVAKGQRQLQYVAAIPIRENTTDWGVGGAPLPSSLKQGSNLDNNTGVETVDEQQLVNYARVIGDYKGSEEVSDSDALLRYAEDLLVHKTVDKDSINAGQISTWSLHIATSEYRFVGPIKVEDTLPDGLCPLGGVNFESSEDVSGECEVTGDAPSLPYTSVTEHEEGSFTLVWDGSEPEMSKLGQMGPSDTFAITFPTKTRAFYQHEYKDQEGAPVLAEDSWTNEVDIEGPDYRICAPSDPLCEAETPTRIWGEETEGTPDFDHSAASQDAPGITIDKKISLPLTPMNCEDAIYVDGPADFGAGDVICWRLRIDFAAKLETGEPRLTDFLPPGVEYVEGSAEETGANSVPSSFDDGEAANGVLTWSLGADVDEEQIFEWTFQTRVLQDPTDTPGVLEGNLMKLSFRNTPGETFPLRDEAEYKHAQPLLSLVKGVRDVNDQPAPEGHPKDHDGVFVAAGDVATFRVDIANEGDLDAEGAEVWDLLEDGIDCEDVKAESISDGGVCTGTRIVWSNLTVAAKAEKTLTYDVTVPAGVEPSRRFDDKAGVVSYTSKTNNGSGTFTYYPQGNIDTEAPPANVPAASDTSWIHTHAVTMTKERKTELEEAGNRLADQATIGERVDYTVKLTIPEGTTVYGSPKLTDPLGSRLTFVEPPEAQAKVNGEPVDGTFALSLNENTLALHFPATYENAAGSGDDLFVLTFSATVADVAANVRGSQVRNEATFTWKHADETNATPIKAHVDTIVVEPNVSTSKTQNDVDKVVAAGQTLTYTVTARNNSGGDVSAAHDVKLVDHVPLGLAPVVSSVEAEGGEWNEAERLITWSVGDLAPGEAKQRSYQVEVVEPATAGETFTNEVEITATSLNGPIGGERTSESTFNTGYVGKAEETVSLGDATLEKSVSPGEATVGQVVTYTVKVDFPANVDYFDATVIDVLPDGMTYADTESVTCDGGACTPASVELGAEPQPDGSSKVGWFLGDFQTGPGGRTVEISYTAFLADKYTPENTPVSNGQTLTNVAEAFYNGSDELTETPTEVPSSGEFSSNSNQDEAQVEVVEPNVTIDKTVSGDSDEDDFRTTVPGDEYTYALTVHNGGDSPAYDVQVTDTPDASDLVEITPLANPEANLTDGDGSDESLAWTIPGPIQAGASVTLQYSAKLAPSSELENGESVLNTAEVPQYWGVEEAVRNANTEPDYRPYAEVPPDSVTLEVHLPELEVTKTPDAGDTPDSVAEVGEPFTWNVVVTNSSTVATAFSVDVHDVLPPNWEYVDGTATFTPGGVVAPTEEIEAPSGDTLVWDNRGDLAPGGELTLTFEAVPTLGATTNPGSGEANPNVNDARATAADSSGATASAEGDYEAKDEGEAVLTLPQLDIEKTPDDKVIKAGEASSYTVVVRNEGSVPAREVVVTDVLGSGQTYDEGTALAAPATGFEETSYAFDSVSGATTVVWEIEEIAPGGLVTITVPIETGAGLPDSTDVTNDASVVSREITTPEEDSGSHEVKVDSDVKIEKQAQAGTVNAGEEMDFTFVVTNDGPSDATGVTVTDELPANLTFVEAESPCAETSAGSNVVSCPIGALEAGDSVELTLTVEVDPDETSGVSNKATVSSTTHDSEPDNNESTADKPIGVQANVQVEKEAPTAPILQWTDFEYVINVDNAGVSAATNVRLEDELPAGVEFLEVSSDVGTCDPPGTKVECSFGTLEPGEGAVVTIRVKALDVGEPENVAEVSTDSVETTEVDNEDPAVVEIVPMADLAVTKTAPETVAAGAELPYGLEVVNNGPSVATGVNLIDTLPPGVQVVSTSAECSADAGVVDCAVGELQVDESKTFTITVLVPYALGDSTLTNSVVVEGNEGDLETENDSDQTTTTVGPAADVSVTKTSGGATAGGTASWTIGVHNAGPSPAPTKVLDVLPGGTSLRSATPSQGSCGASGSEVSCDLGVIPSGGSAQITIVTGVAPGTDNQQLRNRVAVEGGVPDPDLTNNTAEAVTNVTPALGKSGNAGEGSDLVLVKTASTERPRLGEPFSYRLEVTNRGGGEADNVRIIDTMSKAVSLKEVSTTKGKCDGEGSRVTCKLGTLPAGGKAVIKVVVVPIQPGDLRNTASASSAGGGDVEAEDNIGVADVRVTAPKASWKLTKRASRKVVRGGTNVRFAITLRLKGRAVAGARICDPLPSGLVFVKAPGASFRGGKACWKLGYIPAGGKRTVRIVARAERGFAVRRVRNVAEATAGNAKRRVAGARVRINPAFGGAGGGVTG